LQDTDWFYKSSFLKLVQIPEFKHQNPNKSQIPMDQIPMYVALNFGH
jgi:hypothetical protein